MRLIKMKGIVIKEVAYKENDKIVTLLTEELGKISCIAKGAKKTNSSLLASSQYLVYSEFILYKGTSFYHINSATSLNTFYNLRIDFDKLNIAFELTKLIYLVTDENENTNEILRALLNTLYLIQEGEKNINLIISTFKIKLFSLLGFMTYITKCDNCKVSSKELIENKKNIYYEYNTNTFLCENCSLENSKNIKISYSTILAINYVICCDIKKIFSFELNDSALKEYIAFQKFYEESIIKSL